MRTAQRRSEIRHTRLARFVSTVLAWDFARFAIVGSVGVIVDMSVLAAVSPSSTIASSIATRKLVAAETAMLYNFVGNELWMFRRRAVSGRTQRKLSSRFVSFHGVCGLGIAVSVLLLFVQVEFLQVNRYLANGVTICVAAAWNYAINRHLTWRGTLQRAAHTAGRTGTGRTSRNDTLDITLKGR